MSYVPRSYEDIVRDMLTTLTGGTVREVVPVPAALPTGAVAPIPLQKLVNRPVQRVSYLDGTITVGKGAASTDLPYRFTAADFTIADDSIQFRDSGRKPKSGTNLTVNYYPVQTPPVPLNDLNVGSVVRTIMESAAAEIALTYQKLALVYQSAYLDTAANSSLDNVVALVGVQRLAAGNPTATVTFSRNSTSVNQITVPANTVVTDSTGAQYLTVQEITLEPGEQSRDVVAAGSTTGTRMAGVGELNRQQILIEGISSVTNAKAAVRLSAPETDDQLRARTRGALHGAIHGTVDAIRFAVLSVPGVQSVVVTEFPNGVAGEISVIVAYTSSASIDARAQVQSAIDAFRPAGIRVTSSEAASGSVTVSVALTFAGKGLSATDIATVQSNVQSALVSYLGALAPGAAARQSQMVAAIVSDPRVADAHIQLSVGGQPPADSITLNSGQTLNPKTPFTFTVSSETAPVPVTTTVSANLPIQVAVGVTSNEATSSINLSFAAFLKTRSASAPLSIDTLATGIRDDSRFALVRNQVTVTVETSDLRFIQLSDGIGSYSPGQTETLIVGTIAVIPQSGGV